MGGSALGAGVTPEIAVGIALVAWLVVSLGVRSALRLAEADEREDERRAWEEWSKGVDYRSHRERARRWLYELEGEADQGGDEAGRDGASWSFADHLAQLDLEGRVSRTDSQGRPGLYISDDPAPIEREAEDSLRVWMRLHRWRAEADQAQDPPDVRR